MAVRRVGFVGTGNIAETHAAVLKSLPGVSLVAAADPNARSLASFAKRWGIPKTFSTVEEAIAAGTIDVAHVLVPPPLHKPIAEKLLAAGIHVLLEKPMAQSSAECTALQAAAEKSGAKIRVNHNFIHHPSHVAAKRMIAENRIGPVRHVSMRYNLPLRQLGAGQLGHWMFASPLNLLLEQAVHPFSQIDDLIGPVSGLSVRAAPPMKLGEGRNVWRRWLISLESRRGTAQLYLSLGESYPSWAAEIIGDDGVIYADYVRSRTAYETSGRYGDFFDDFRNGLAMAWALASRSIGNLSSYAAATLKLCPRSDAFYRSMYGSLNAFYRDLENKSGDLSGGDGRRLVELCERAVSEAALEVQGASHARVRDDAHYDVLVIGGTGFIGSRVVARFAESGKRVGVLARSLNNLPQPFFRPEVTLVKGDARNAADVAKAIGNTRIVVNLAHGGGGGSRADVEESLVGSAKTVAQCSLDRKVDRLIFVSTIAALYLGNSQQVVKGFTPPDSKPDSRGDYARAKILAEQEMLALFRDKGLPVTILRPGIVIGEGTSPFHSGIGFFNHETHCLGWNRGLNPLPLVLVDDVADAIIKAVDVRGIEGKCYNLVGDVRLSAREYVTHLAKVTGRPLRYHPQSVYKLYVIELMKALIKRATGRRDPLPSLRDLKSRGLAAQFDCSDAKRDLNWEPLCDRAVFLDRGFPGNDAV